MATALVKLSIGLFLLRFAVERTQIYIIYAALTMSIGTFIFGFFYTLFECRPISQFWEHVVNPHGSCVSSQIEINAIYAYAAMICAVDLIYGILPIFIIWKMNLSIRTRVYLAVILALGSV